MAYIWFNQVLEALGKRLNYDSISNLYGNSFAKDAAKLIQSANPLIKAGAVGGGNVIDLMNMSKVKVIDLTAGKDGKSAKDAAKDALTKQLGDISWAEGLF